MAMLKLVAKRLGPLKESFVFLGGATTGLLITDQAALQIHIFRN